jgi:putative oxidoreductase
MNAIATLLRRSQPVTAWLDTWLQPVALLALRLYLARVFFLAGLTKIQDWDTTLFLFSEEYRVPLLSPTLAAVLGTAGELLLPPLLLLGLAGRFAALGLFVLNILAVLSYWLALDGSALEFHLQWGLMLLLLLATGPGKLALDKLLRQRLG